MKSILEARGKFQVWSYTVSHKQLLLRRVKSDEHPTRIDVLFKNVAYMQLPTVFDGLSLHELEIKDLPPLGEHKVYDRYAYKINGMNCDGLIIAGAVIWNEDEGEYYEESALLPTLKG